MGSTSRRRVKAGCLAADASRRTRCAPSPLALSLRRAVRTGVVSGELRRTLSAFATRWAHHEFPVSVAFKLNPRLRSTLARWVLRTRTLELSNPFFDLPDRHREILCHELAHAIVVHEHGRSARPHGVEWQELVRKAGFAPTVRQRSLRRRLPPRASHGAILAYEHRCPVCHAVRLGRRAVASWRCAECTGAGLAGELIIRVVSRSAISP